MQHPVYPLMAEERAEIQAAIESRKPRLIQGILEKYTERRNRECPGWKLRYEKELREWRKSQRAESADGIAQEARRMANDGFEEPRSQRKTIAERAPEMTDESLPFD